MANFDEEVNFGDWSSLDINVSRRVPICLVLDRSGSMEEKDGSSQTKIEELNKNLKEFLDYVRGNAKASRICDICIISFGGVDEVDVVCGYTNIKDLKCPPLKPYGRTPLGASVQLALDLLQKRRDYYRNNSIEHYKPILMIMSDGQPTEKDNVVYEAAQRCTDAVNNEGLKVLPIGIGQSARLDILDMFSPKVKAKCIDNMDVFVQLFEMLSRSMSTSDNTVFDWLNDQV